MKRVTRTPKRLVKAPPVLVQSESARNQTRTVRARRTKEAGNGKASVQHTVGSVGESDILRPTGSLKQRDVK